MAERSPAFQFYPKDWLSDINVMRMTCEQRGAYIQLLAICWVEGSIPSDKDLLVRLTGCDGSAIAEPLAMFVPSHSDATRLVNPRLEKERSKQEKHRAERAESGRKGANSRWNEQHNPDGSAMAQPSTVVIAEPIANDGFAVCSLQSSSSSKDPSINKHLSKDASCIEPKNPGSPPSPVVCRLPLNDKTFCKITEADVSRFGELYPAVDVDQELRNMLGWLEAVPTRRKTRTGIRKFVNGWLAKEQNRGGSRNGHSKQSSRDIIAAALGENDERLAGRGAEA